MSLALPNSCREQKDAPVHPESYLTNNTMPISEEASGLTFERLYLHSTIKLIPISFPCTPSLLLTDAHMVFILCLYKTVKILETSCIADQLLHDLKNSPVVQSTE